MVGGRGRFVARDHPRFADHDNLYTKIHEIDVDPRLSERRANRLGLDKVLRRRDSDAEINHDSIGEETPPPSWCFGDGVDGNAVVRNAGSRGHCVSETNLRVISEDIYSAADLRRLRDWLRLVIHISDITGPTDHPITLVYEETGEN